MQELEDKAPCLRKQRDDYEKALETISLMTQQLNKSVMVRYTLKEMCLNALNIQLFLWFLGV